MTLPAAVPFADHLLPAVDVLLTSQAETLVSAAFAAADEVVSDLVIRQVRYRPGRAITVSYEGKVGPGGGPSRVATIVAHAGERMPDGVVTLEDGAVRAGVWRFPNDPVLAGVRHAVDGNLLEALLAGFGIAGPVTALNTRSYRPTRRAVIEVTTPDRRLFLKVVRPDKLPGLAHRHETVAARGLAPSVLGTARGLGVVALEALDGLPLRDLLTLADQGRPTSADLVALLERLPEIAPEAPGAVGRMHHHAKLLAAVVPPLRDRLDEVLGLVDEPALEPPRPVHGDFHPGQVMTVDGKPSGLIDVDTVGTGQRADDLATMLGYLSARLLDRGRAGSYAYYGENLYLGFTSVVNAATLRPRIAAALVGYATMPFVTLRPGWQHATARLIDRALWWASASGAGKVG